MIKKHFHENHIHETRHIVPYLLSILLTMHLHNISYFFLGLRDLPLREASSPPVHFPEEEPQEEGDGLLLLGHVRQVPPRAVQLHRPARAVHTREFIKHFKFKLTTFFKRLRKRLR